MGVRLATNLKGSRFTAVDHVEVSAEGRKRLKDTTGFDCVAEDQALAEADVIVLAVPDRLIGKIAHQIIGRVRPGALLIVLDAAALYAGEMPSRSDVSYLRHPSSPPLRVPENVTDGQRDLLRRRQRSAGDRLRADPGPEEHYALGEEVARTIYAPVNRAHRCTLEHIAIMEPAMSETVGATLCLALREATDEAVRRGVPQAAAMDFMLGHIQIELAIAFNIFEEGKFSDGALHAIREARPLIFKDNWLDAVFSPDAVMASVKDICNPKQAA